MTVEDFINLPPGTIVKCGRTHDVILHSDLLDTHVLVLNSVRFERTPVPEWIPRENAQLYDVERDEEIIEDVKQNLRHYSVVANTMQDVCNKAVEEAK